LGACAASAGSAKAADPRVIAHAATSASASAANDAAREPLRSAADSAKTGARRIDHHWSRDREEECVRDEVNQIERHAREHVGPREACDQRVCEVGGQV